MAIEVKREGNTVSFEFGVNAAEFEDAVQKSYKKNAGKVTIQGFRRGHAPRALIERYYGKEFFYEDAINILLPVAYDKALEEVCIKPVAEPKFDVKDMDGISENGVTFIAEVEVLPEFDLPEYKGIEVEKPSYPVADSDVTERLEAMRERNSRLVNIEERSIQKDDIATIDFEGFVDNVPFEGGKGGNHPLTIGAGQFIPGFEEQLIGKNLGETTNVHVTFPKDYHTAELAGKPAIFKVTVNQIQNKELPVLDDEFAKDVSEFDTLKELKADIAAKIKADNGNKEKVELENKILETISANTTVELPKALVNKRIEDMFRSLDARLRYQGMDLSTYMQYANLTVEKMRDEFKEKAEQYVKVDLILDKIAEIEGIKATEEEIQAKYAELAKDQSVTPDDMKKYVTAEELTRDLAHAKVLDMLTTSAKLTSDGKKPAKAKAGAKSAEVKPAAKETAKTAAVKAAAAKKPAKADEAKPAAKKPAAKKTDAK